MSTAMHILEYVVWMDCGLLSTKIHALSCFDKTFISIGLDVSGKLMDLTVEIM